MVAVRERPTAVGQPEPEPSLPGPIRPTIESVFSEYEAKAWPHLFAVTLHVDELHGGTPTDKKVAEAWIRAKGPGGSDAEVKGHVNRLMAERSIPFEEAVTQTIEETKLNGFKFDSKGLYIEGRQIKAAIKEAFSTALAAGKLPKRWGETNKGTLGFVPEHIFIPETRVYLGVTRAEWAAVEADGDGSERFGIEQRFIHTYRGSAIQYEEYARDVDLHFTLKSDHGFTHDQWAMVWLTGESQGVGASRSQGYGTYKVTQWKPIR